MTSSSSFAPHLQPESRVVLVDSSGVLFRCFDGYKEPRMGQWDGRPVDMAALFGYLYYLQRIYREFEFEDLIHVQDAPGGSFYRYQLFPEYKGHREERPLLETPKAMLPSVLEAFGEKVVKRRGVEADDLIGALAHQLAEEGHMVMIVSNDKDLMQLVNDNISICRYVSDPQGPGKLHDVYGEKEVFEKLGVRPDQVADWLALMGDDSDNIPGVANVGEKKAQKLIQDYGDIPTLITRAAEIKGALGENVRQALPHLPLYKKLTTILREVPGLVYPMSPEVSPEQRQKVFQALQWKEHWPQRFEVKMEGFKEDFGLQNRPMAPTNSPVATKSVAASQPTTMPDPRSAPIPPSSMTETSLPSPSRPKRIG